MKVYIAGPMSGLPDFNRPAFREAKEQMAMAGHEAVSPTDNGLPEAATWEDHMRADIRLLLGCDAIHRLPGWEQSRGARLESSVADALRLVVIK